MYKYSNGQISLADFRQPVGMHMKESNRWVKKGKEWYFGYKAYIGSVQTVKH